jgi:hypothetical protein
MMEDGFLKAAGVSLFLPTNSKYGRISLRHDQSVQRVNYLPEILKSSKL